MRKVRRAEATAQLSPPAFAKLPRQQPRVCLKAAQARLSVSVLYTRSVNLENLRPIREISSSGMIRTRDDLLARNGQPSCCDGRYDFILVAELAGSVDKRLSRRIGPANHA